MYSSLPSTIDTINSGGLTHCFPSSATEHLSGIIIKLKIISDINLE
jgi:hypothetical protein